MILKICPQYSEDPITTQSKLNHQPLLTTTSTTPLEFTMLSTSKTIQKRGGEKPYGCRLCAYSSAFSDHLNTHMLTHTGEKPFSCKQCEYKCTLCIAQQMITSRDTSGHIQERSLSIAISVSSPAHKLVTSNNTC